MLERIDPKEKEYLEENFLLPEELVETRLKQINSVDNLNQIPDMIIAFSKCEGCGKYSVDINFLGGGYPEMNNIPKLAKILIENPLQFLPNLGMANKQCICRDKLKYKNKLIGLFLLRTNPSLKNDLHIIINYEVDKKRSPIELATLSKEGLYQFVSEEKRIETLGF